MGYYMVLGQCYRCGHLFTFNPHLVPSLTVEGVKQPFCSGCIKEVNPIRVANGLQPIVPLRGAYEPIEEGEL